MIRPIDTFKSSYSCKYVFQSPYSAYKNASTLKPLADKPPSRDINSPAIISNATAISPNHITHIYTASERGKAQRAPVSILDPRENGMANGNMLYLCKCVPSNIIQPNIVRSAFDTTRKEGSERLLLLPFLFFFVRHIFSARPPESSCLLPLHAAERTAFTPSYRHQADART